MESLGRGVVAVRTGSSQVYVGWRMLGTEWGQIIGYHIYRGQTRITSSPITNSTNYVDAASVNSDYRVTLSSTASKAAVGPGEVGRRFINCFRFSGLPAAQAARRESIPSVRRLQRPATDRRRRIEIIVKWDPSNAKDNAQSGYTGNVYRMRKAGRDVFGAHRLGPQFPGRGAYSQFRVLTRHDGIAEVDCKTAPVTIEGQGNDACWAATTRTPTTAMAAVTSCPGRNI